VAQQAKEDEWVRKAQTGDRTAFAALVERYWNPLRRWLFGLTGREHLAEDFTQEAFFRAWSALPQLHTADAFRAWIFRVARNCLISSKRGPRGAATAALPEDLADRDAGPLEKVVEDEGQQQLRAALARLPETYRAVYLLMTEEDWSYSQIAAVLEITEETARWRVCKARQFLLKELRAYLDSSSS
jgi:RNA polymerase sigma-70 factor (ECF subfamily)